MTESDEQKIHREDIKNKQMDKEMSEIEMSEIGRHREEYDAKAVNDPRDRLLHDLARDISDVKNRLTDIESILYKLLESKEKDL
jgi:hypothetical protein